MLQSMAGLAVVRSALGGLSMQRWFCTVGMDSMEQQTAEPGCCGFIFSPVSGLLCGCPILLTHQPCGNWFGVSCQNLESWPQCRLRQAKQWKAFLNSSQDGGIRTHCLRCKEALVKGKYLWKLKVPLNPVQTGKVNPPRWMNQQVQLRSCTSPCFYWF